MRRRHDDNDNMPRRFEKSKTGPTGSAWPHCGLNRTHHRLAVMVVCALVPLCFYYSWVPAAEKCLVKISHVKGKSREFVCPTLDASIVFGEWFLDNSSDAGCDENPYFQGKLPKGCSPGVAVQVHTQRFKTMTDERKFPFVHKYTETSCLSQGAQSITIPSAWSNYQLIDQTQRPCGIRACPNAMPTCTVQDLDIPAGSLADEMGAKFGIARKAASQQGQQMTYDDWTKSAMESLQERMEKYPVKGAPKSTDLVIHLRVGDVVDGSSF